MKNIREIITDLNVARSNSCSQEKSEEIKGIIQNLLPYAETEEELGIDLLTLFKALKNGIVACCDNPFGGKRNVFVSLTHDRLSIEYKNKCLRKGKNKFYFKDYGKTWVLTDKELLCQK